jgi:hypothetical protein
MASTIKHRKVNIVTLEPGEQVLEYCKPYDIAIMPSAEGWWLKFVDAQGQVDCYGAPYPSLNHALWSAKAAAEFGTE